MRPTGHPAPRPLSWPSTRGAATPSPIPSPLAPPFPSPGRSSSCCCADVVQASPRGDAPPLMRTVLQGGCWAPVLAQFVPSLGAVETSAMNFRSAAIPPSVGKASLTEFVHGAAALNREEHDVFG